MLTNHHRSWRTFLLFVAGILACVYALSVLAYVQSIPDIGLRCAYSPVVNVVDPNFLRGDAPSPMALRECTIVELGGRPVDTWPQLLRALLALRVEPVQATDPPEKGAHTHIRCGS